MRWVLPLAGLLGLAYFLGSIPVGLIVAWLKTGGDLRKMGSGRTGATNVMRSAGRRLGFLTLFLDGLKAGLAVIIATVLWPHIEAWGGAPIGVAIVQGLSGMAAIIGHNHPLLAGFHGGRGVSSYFGTMCIIHLPAALLGIEVLALVALLSRYMSLGSILGGLTTFALLVVLYIIGWALLPHVVYSGVAVGILVFEHRDNIARLKAGTERKLY
ncbi:MAG: glycerol-3-phosphate acyltransferase [Chloroflexota bacterium]